METSIIQFFKKSTIADLKKLGYFRKKLTQRLVQSLIVIGCASILLLSTQCQPYVDQDPQPTSSINEAANPQSNTTDDGVVAQSVFIPEVLPSGEIILISVPANWNGELILYAPGYTPAFEPLKIASAVSTYGPMFTSYGYAFATTSYSQNGLAVLTGIQDMINLRNIFIERHGQPKEIYLTGASEGGLVTTLALERYPELWSGGLSLCGPCGDFQGQINYYGNFRVLFDYFFPGVLPGNVIDFPDEMITNWESVYVPAILQAITLNPLNTLKLLKTAKAPFIPSEPSTIPQTVIRVLTYNLFVRDAIVKLEGQPFDNTVTRYSGTGNIMEDLQLNLAVQRYKADVEALQNIKTFYETSGMIKKPLVKSHTTHDPIQLFRQLPLYQNKVPLSQRLLLLAVPIHRYGHCTFTPEEIGTLFTLLINNVKRQQQQPLVSAK